MEKSLIGGHAVPDIIAGLYRLKAQTSETAVTRANLLSKIYSEDKLFVGLGAAIELGYVAKHYDTPDRKLRYFLTISGVKQARALCDVDAALFGGRA